MADEPEPDEAEAQRDTLFAWRKEQFEKLGFAEYAADLLASKGVSPSAARCRLLQRGCPLDEALHILL